LPRSRDAGRRRFPRTSAFQYFRNVGTKTLPHYQGSRYTGHAASPEIP
jgi:hypothetical protein